MNDPLLNENMPVLAALIGVLAVLFFLDRHPKYGKIFKVVPLLVFAYFVPTLLSNTGIIPLSDDFELYKFVKAWLLPASLLLLTLSVDIPAILGLGKPALILFVSATIGIVLGGPLAYAAFGWLVPPESGEQAWRGLAALSGSWIGGGANFLAIGENFEAGSAIIALMVVVDVAVANIWTATLLFFAGRDEKMDAKIKADRSSIETLKKKVEDYQAEVSRPTNLPDLLMISALALGGTAIAASLAPLLPTLEFMAKGGLIKEFTWIVLIVTTIGLGLSFTRMRGLEGAGASRVGSVFLYILVATIGAKADFAKIFEQPELFVVGAVWMLFHAVIMLVVRWRMRAPIFFMAVGSQANVGGAASAPVVAAAFHPSLATVGVLLAVGGYVVGTYAGIVCGWLLNLVYDGMYAGGVG